MSKKERRDSLHLLPSLQQPYSSDLSWRQLVAHLATGAISVFVAGEVLAWLPTCLEMLKVPGGGVTHDPWAWAPFVLDLAAAIAVAAPTSFGKLLDAARLLRRAPDK